MITKNKCVKIISIILTLAITVMIVPIVHGSEASAASAMIEFALASEKVNAGDTFSVTMTVNASDSIDSVDAYVSYDSNIIEFKSGGKYVSGSSGLLHVLAEGLGGEKSKLKFALKFTALSAGDCAVNLSDVANVKSTAEVMSTSSNRLSISIGGSSAAPSAQNSSAPSSITDSVSGDNTLSSLKISNGTLEPAFDLNKTKYTTTLGNDVDTLYFSYQASDPDAVVAIEGNEGLIEGKNTVKVIVTAANKDKKEYNIIVTRETAEETAEREAKENGDTGSGIGFNVYNENGKVYIQNQYKFQIIDADENAKIPAGYKKTSVLLYGVNVTAYTIASDLDNEYLLMYCVSEDGNKEFYQFDRQEKSLQRYTGDLIDRVNESAQSGDLNDTMTSNEYEKNLSQMAVIIAILVAFCVLLLLGIISIILKQMKNKTKKSGDELDF